MTVVVWAPSGFRIFAAAQGGRTEAEDRVHCRECAPHPLRVIERKPSLQNLAPADSAQLTRRLQVRADDALETARLRRCQKHRLWRQ